METGSTHWENPNAGSTNSSGFTTLPGGYRSNHGAFAKIGFFWFLVVSYRKLPHNFMVQNNGLCRDRCAQNLQY
jgi:hypothetical protein